MAASARKAPSSKADAKTPARAATRAPAVAAGARAESADAGVSLSQRAYDLIKRKILSLELRPGSFLNEASLCTLTGLGRMPVHQAIHRLQGEGLIEVIPRKGLVIRADSLHDILELLEARLAMEPNIAALAAERITREQTAELRALLQKSRAMHSQDQRESFRLIDRAFHQIVADAAGNKVLAAAQRPLHERSNIIWHLTIMPDEGLDVTQREHEAILKAILNHDATAARDTMQAHLLSLQKRILSASRR